MQKSKKSTADLNYVWDNISVYSTRPNIKVTSKLYKSDKCERASCSLKNAVKFLYADSSVDYTEENALLAKDIKRAKVSLAKIDKRSYLTDNGLTFMYLKNNKGIKKSEFIRLLKKIDSDYDLFVLNDELCVEIEDPSCLIDCYRNLVSVSRKVKCLSDIY